MLRIVIDVLERYQGYYNYSRTTKVLKIICRHTKKNGLNVK